MYESNHLLLVCNGILSEAHSDAAEDDRRKSGLLFPDYALTAVLVCRPLSHDRRSQGCGSWVLIAVVYLARVNAEL
jgi:hypothetical protein